MSFSDTAKSIISTVAPLLGTALGGPLGGLAGGLLSKALGKKDPVTQEVVPATVKDIEAALGVQDPATMLALKQAENDLTKHMADLGIEEEQLKYADVDSARKREMAVRDHTPAILIYLLTAGFFGLVFCLMKVDVPADNKAVLYSLVGTLGSAWLMGVGYFFGSSIGSGDKTNGLLEALKNKK